MLRKSFHSRNYNRRYVLSRAAVVHFNFRAGSTFPVPVCTVPHGLWVNKADTQQDYPVQQGGRGQTLCFI